MKSHRILLLALGCLLATIISGPELLSPQWFYIRAASDGIRYPYLIEQFYNSFHQGVWYPRWLYRMNGGYGYPTFLLYQPGYWFLSLPFMSVLGDPVASAKALRFFSIVITFLGMVRLAEQLGNSRNRSILLSLFLAKVWGLYLYHHSGSVALMFTVWGFRFFYALLEKGSERKTGKSFLGFILCTSAAFYSHPFTAIFYGMIIGFSSAGHLLSRSASKEERRQLLSLLTLASLAIAALTSPYWYTNQYFVDKVNFSFEGVKGLSPLWAFSKNTDTGWLFIYQYILHTFNTSPQLGYGMLLFAFTFIAFWRLRKQYAFALLLVPYLIGLFFLTRFSIPLWQNIHALSYLQTHLRFWLLLDLISCILMCRASASLPFPVIPDKWRIPAGAAAIALLLGWNILTYQPFPSLAPPEMDWSDTVEYEQAKNRDETTKFVSYQAANEFFPRTASLQNLPNRIRDHIPVMQGDEHIRVEKKAGLPFRAHITSAGYAGSGTVLINQFYLPGWRVEVDGAALTLDDPQKNDPAQLHLDANGRMVLTFPTVGVHDITAYYDGPPDWQWRNALSLIALLLTGYGYYRLQQRGKSAI